VFAGAGLIVVGVIWNLYSAATPKPKTASPADA
jgi:hypothetical protein